MTLSMMAVHCYAECRLCCLLFMLSVTCKPDLLNVVMLSAVMLNVVMLSAVAPVQTPKHGHCAKLGGLKNTIYFFLFF